jgi:hypothetical protein
MSWAISWTSRVQTVSNRERDVTTWGNLWRVKLWGSLALALLASRKKAGSCLNPFRVEEATRFRARLHSFPPARNKLLGPLTALLPIWHSLLFFLALSDCNVCARRSAQPCCRATENLSIPDAGESRQLAPKRVVRACPQRAMARDEGREGDAAGGWCRVVSSVLDGSGFADLSRARTSAD